MANVPVPGAAAGGCGDSGARWADGPVAGPGAGGGGGWVVPGELPEGVAG